jgi:hypothetical protein
MPSLPTTFFLFVTFPLAVSLLTHSPPGMATGLHRSNQVTGDDIQALFTKARDDFLSELSAGEKLTFSKCSSAEELLASCDKFHVIAKAKRRGIPSFRRIKSLSDNLTPYFKIIEISCATHPEWALAFGALRLVLTVSLTFKVEI